MSDGDEREILCWVMNGKVGLPAKLMARIDPVRDDPRLILRLVQPGQADVEINIGECEAEALAELVDDEMSSRDWGEEP